MKFRPPLETSLLEERTTVNYSLDNGKQKGEAQLPVTRMRELRFQKTEAGYAMLARPYLGDVPPKGDRSITYQFDSLGHLLSIAGYHEYYLQGRDEGHVTDEELKAAEQQVTSGTLLAVEQAYWTDLLAGITGETIRLGDIFRRESKLLSRLFGAGRMIGWTVKDIRETDGRTEVEIRGDSKFSLDDELSTAAREHRSSRAIRFTARRVFDAGTTLPILSESTRSVLDEEPAQDGSVALRESVYRAEVKLKKLP